MDQETLVRRLLGARTYLEFRADCTPENWADRFRRYQDSKSQSWKGKGLLGTPEVMALCDPRLWLADLGCSMEQILDGRSFETAPPEARCEADVLLGYSCPLFDQGIQADHFFPYSLGGKTDPGNRLYLCRFHNRGKGCDINLYPWEEPPQEWACSLLDEVGGRLDLPA